MNKINSICLLLFIIVVSNSCVKDSETFSVSSSQQSSVSQKHFIGEHFGGGIIFYLDKTKMHGLIAAPEDFEEPAVWSKKDTLNGAKSAKIGGGRANSNGIYKTQGNPQDEGDDYAALECVELTENGYSDWYLPSKDELNEIYLHKDVIGGFLPFSYWSSTEVNATTAWYQNFSTGTQVIEVKIGGYGIRPVRYF
jgi:hypothetical protein